MKVAVAFLGNKNKKYVMNFVNKIIMNVYLIVCFAFFVTILYFVLNNTNILNKILILSTNFRKTDNNEYSILELATLNGVFNERNYNFSEIVEEKEPENIVQVSISENISEYEVFDMVANEFEDTKSVFANIPTAVITAENLSLQRVTFGDINILNYSSKRDLDFSALASKYIFLTKQTDKILLYHTHTSETYTNSEKYKFDYTGTMRTTDAEYNMLKVGKEFNESLKSKGFNSVQNTTPHDYGSYSSAYTKSRITVTDALNDMSGASICIDVHRDAIENLEYRPIANVKGIDVAQLMLVIGVGYDSSENPYYADNLALALQIQMLAEKVYPGLFKPMIIRDATYNQDLNKYSILIEVGATGNTLDEAIFATRCLTNLLNILYKD